MAHRKYTLFCALGIGLVAAGFAPRSEADDVLDRDVNAFSTEVHTKPKPARKSELNFFPIIGGDSDVGIGGGQVSNLAMVDPSTDTVLWRIEDASFLSFKARGGGLIIPFLDIYAMLTVPRLGQQGRFRLDLRASFTDERNLGYYGIGNASAAPPGLTPEQTEYRRLHPGLAARLRLQLQGDVRLIAGSFTVFSWLDVGKDSLLMQQATSGPPEVRSLLGGFQAHAIELLELGLEYDTRDKETVSHSGQYHSVLARVSPGIASWMPYTYVQLDVVLRFYQTIVPRWLYVSLRVVGDTLLGRPPFYELARFEDTSAIGGGKAVRGVPAQRYHGKVKLFENLEVQSEILHFSVADKRFVLGCALFVDAGRTWTELGRAQPALDGSGVGLKLGLGGGLRFQEGRTFVVRADVAWSPDARPIGGYFAAGEIF